MDAFAKGLQKGWKDARQISAKTYDVIDPKFGSYFILRVKGTKIVGVIGPFDKETKPFIQKFLGEIDEVEILETKTY